MGWDPGIMRKFAATSHQRLIHQLRDELRKDNPAPQLPTTASEPARGPSSAPQRNTASPGQEKRSRSFRQRLNAVDMR